MAIKGKISGILLTLLLLFIRSNGVVCSGPEPGNSLSRYSTLQKGYERTVVSFTRHTIVKDWVKVRYKGGEMPIFGVTVPIQVRPFAVVTQIRGLKYIPFVSLPYYSSSKLRGPPAYLS